MGGLLQFWILSLIGVFGILCVWRTFIIWENPVLTKASIQVDLTLPTTAIINQRFINITNQKSPRFRKKKHHSSISRYMIQLYHRRPIADIVRALKPFHISAPIQYKGGGRILEFQMPPANPEENLEAAELLGTAGMILRVKFIDNFNIVQEEKQEFVFSRREESWRAFNVTIAVKMSKRNFIKFLVRGKVKGRPESESPILLLSYRKPVKRKKRSVVDEEADENSSPTWPESKRRRRNPCRKRPLYVDFATINYDEWVVAPPGYDAYQCVGKCLFPFGDHLSPTKHAIVQALVHGALQGVDGKSVGRVCCVPTRLAPTSLLYLDSSGTLTYQYGYEDMVVVECGCR
ncbi:inhibin beta A chain-like [Chelonus insularis]|uniref:inhibin beta A chain-like n=1 Tax=Chelonus insularis TaxID=460826 RepID=UPI00158BB547|nr:inhibin beta A chain-like [Chelonus insularis]